MAIYLITYLDNNRDKVNAEIEAKIDSRDRFLLQGNAGCLICFGGTTKELFDLICKKENTNPPQYIGCVIVTPANSYYGYGSSEMWDWLKTRSESTYVPKK